MIAFYSLLRPEYLVVHVVRLLQYQVVRSMYYYVSSRLALT